MKSHSIEVAAHKAEKATNDPLYKERRGRRKTEKTETGSGKRGLAVGRSVRILSELRRFC